MILLTGENKMDDLTLRKTVAENLVYYRRKKGLTQLALAETLNYSDKSISKWERGEGLPDLTVLYRLAEYYGITLNDLVSQRSEEEAAEAADETERDTAEVSMRSRILVPVLSIGLVWLAAMVGFFLLEILPFEFAYSHLLFIYAIPISCVVALVFSCIWWLYWLRFVCVSCLIWSVALCLYLTFALPSFGLIFAVAGILQGLAVLWFIQIRK